jgi:sulfur carrier protein
MQFILPQGKSKWSSSTRPFLKYQTIKGMEIIINNQKKQLGSDNITVQQLLNMEIPKKQKGIAIAINNMVVPKIQWEETTINHNDNIIIIKATQGG